MLAYQFYLNDGFGEATLIGILPERRRNRVRINQESIMKWGKLAAGSFVDPKKIYFIKTELQKELKF